MSKAFEVEIDLYATIDKLLFFKSDLESYYWDREGEGDLPERERHQIASWMRLVGERALSLEDVVMHMGCPTVVVRVSKEERESLRCAVHLLDRSVDEGEPFDEILRSVATVLNAADVISLRATGGRPDAAARRAPAQIERIAPSSSSRMGLVLARIVPKSPPEPTEAEENEETPTRNVGS
jgi:hypothetical protein